MPAKPKSIDKLDIWRIIPPEEKLEILANAHSRGTLAVMMAVIMGATSAISLQEPWIFWGTLIAIPFVFQFTSSKTWRQAKPSLVLRYLAARSAARRLAFAKRAADLNCTLLFRGKLERLFDDDHMQEALEAIIDSNKENEVWIALFRDTIVMMSEKIGGAKLEFGHTINDKLRVEGFSPSGGDYVSDKELLISHPEDEDLDSLLGDKDERQVRYRLTSRYPAALVAFEKKIIELRQVNKEIAERALQVVAAILPLDSNDDGPQIDFGRDD